MSERVKGSYNDALYKSTYTLLYFTFCTGIAAASSTWSSTCHCICCIWSSIIKAVFIRSTCRTWTRRIVCWFYWWNTKFFSLLSQLTLYSNQESMFLIK